MHELVTGGDECDLGGVVGDGRTRRAVVCVQWINSRRAGERAVPRSRLNSTSLSRRLADQRTLRPVRKRPGRCRRIGAASANLLSGTGPTFRRGSRFAQWSRRYVLKLAAADAVVGAAATAIPASFSGTLGHPPSSVAMLALIGAVVWPLAIGLSRGYQRSRVGIGSDELRAVMRAAVAVVVAGAFPAGLFDQHALLTLVVVGYAAGSGLEHRQPLRVTEDPAPAAAGRPQRTPRHRGRQSGCGPAAHERLEREPHCGMKVVGVCLPIRSCDPPATFASRCSAACATSLSSSARLGVRCGRRHHRRRDALQLPARAVLGPRRHRRRDARRSRAWSRSPVRGCTSGP